MEPGCEGAGWCERRPVREADAAHALARRAGRLCGMGHMCGDGWAHRALHCEQRRRWPWHACGCWRRWDAQQLEERLRQAYGSSLPDEWRQLIVKQVRASPAGRVRDPPSSAGPVAQRGRSQRGHGGGSGTQHAEAA